MEALNSNGDDSRDQPRRCFEEWISQQKCDLDELLQASPSDEQLLRSLVAKSLRCYEDYAARRRTLARGGAGGVTAFFAPTWCASFENSLLWIGGCRPTLFIRLLYTLTGSEVEAEMEALFSESDQNGGHAVTRGLAVHQLGLVNDLHERTIRAEDALSTRVASLQEDVADKPLLPIVKCGLVEAAAVVMDGFEAKLAGMMEEADQLRLRTVRVLVVEILSPRQAVDLLAAAKQLHLSLHEWSRDRDNRRSSRV